MQEIVPRHENKENKNRDKDICKGMVVRGRLKSREGMEMRLQLFHREVRALYQINSKYYDMLSDSCAFRELTVLIPFHLEVDFQDPQLSLPIEIGQNIPKSRANAKALAIMYAPVLLKGSSLPTEGILKREECTEHTHTLGR